MVIGEQLYQNENRPMTFTHADWTLTSGRLPITKATVTAVDPRTFYRMNRQTPSQHNDDRP